MKNGIISGAIILTAIGGATLLNSNNKIAYNGGYAPDGSYCDYGYNTNTKECCNEDDYTCEIRDKELSKEKSFSNYNDKNCDDFSSQAQAQTFFRDNGGPSNDPHGLDRDGDGVVCESLK